MHKSSEALFQKDTLNRLKKYGESNDQSDQIILRTDSYAGRRRRSCGVVDCEASEVIGDIKKVEATNAAK